MWIWLTISLLLVIACVIFGIYSFMSSRTLQRKISSEPESNKHHTKLQLKRESLSVFEQQNTSDLKIILKSIEDTSSINIHHLSEIQNRLEALESASNSNKVSDDNEWDNSKEDWEKLYYEARKDKTSLEDDLKNINDALQTNIDKLQAMEKKQADIIAVKSDMALKINEVLFLQNTINQLHHKLEGAKEREKELEQQIATGRTFDIEYESLYNHNNQLHSEIEMLTNELQQINDENMVMKQKIKGLTELGRTLEHQHIKI